ncbi:hypothetical protein VTL71DRAFT_9330 [Oculimacula yallundae]|uniref:Heterokaryon incompatibility domain-containing protein n=1 Tax=Oculimacula yallundae TaxID=86028 RepID=A0ABR4BSR3_9HELO
MASTTATSYTTIVEDSLCLQCSKLDLRRYLAPLTLRLYWDLPKYITFDPPLLVSTSTSCALCRLLAQSIKPPPDGHSHSASVPINGVRFEDLGNTLTLAGAPTKSLCMIADGPNAFQIAPYGRNAFRLGARGGSYARLLQPDCANLDLIKSWLRKCEQGHQECLVACLKSNSQVTVPQYVIDVEGMQVREVGTKKLRYLALSYVWGETKQLLLERANLNRLTKSNALQECFDQLSKVARDAITFTQNIGERYLWIDTLCICQDNEVTKKVQIDSMNIVYAQATLTLVALEGDNSSYGLPGVQPYSKPRHQPVEHVHQLRMTTVMPNISELEKLSEWRRRAWTYQEELFSKRLLFFTDHQVYFRCQRSTLCEDRFEDYSGSLTTQFMDVLNEPEPLRSFAMWKQCVINYSTRDFHKNVDRYNAFAGIEHELKHRWKLPCITGIPVDYLVRGLYWHLHVIDKTQQRCADLRRISTYPSWSWCGWKGSVILPPLDIRFEMSTVEISGTTYTFNDDGRMVSPPADSEQPQLEEVMMGREKRPESLIFSAYSSRLHLNTSRFASDGILSVTPLRKVCGIIYGGHLPLKSISQDEAVLYECILIGSCSRVSAFDCCNYASPGHSKFMSWAYSAETNREIPQKLSEVHQRTIIRSGPLKIMPGTDYRWGVKLNSLEKIRCKVKLFDWLCKFIWLLITFIGYVLLYTGYIVGAALAVGIGIGLLIPAAGLALGILLALCIIIQPAMILVGIFCWTVQKFYNSRPGATKMWYAWDSMRCTRLGRWIDRKCVDRLPLRYLCFLYRFWSKPTDDIELEQSRWQKQRDQPQTDNNVVLIMLVESHPRRGADVCERLAVGEMSARCWWDTKPVQRRIVLQ